MSDQQRFRQRAGSAQQPARAKHRDSRGKMFYMENFGVRLWRGGYAVKKSYHRRAGEGATPSKNRTTGERLLCEISNSDFPGVDPAQQQVRLNVTGVLLTYTTAGAMTIGFEQWCVSLIYS